MTKDNPFEHPIDLENFHETMINGRDLLGRVVGYERMDTTIEREVEDAIDVTERAIIYLQTNLYSARETYAKLERERVVTSAENIANYSAEESREMELVTKFIGKEPTTLDERIAKSEELLHNIKSKRDSFSLISLGYHSPLHTIRTLAKRLYDEIEE